MHEAIGIDLGLRSGAVVKVLFENVAGRPVIHGIETFWVESRRSLTRAARRRGEKLPLLDPAGLALVGQEQLRELLQDEELDDVPIGIDWGLHEVWMRGSKKFAFQKAFLAGYIYRVLLEKGGCPLFIPPNEVRNTLGIKANAVKDEVHAAFLKLLGPTITPAAWTEHEIDATVLAILAHKNLRTEKVWTQLMHA